MVQNLIPLCTVTTDQNLKEKSFKRWHGFNSTSIFFFSASILSLARSTLSQDNGLGGRSTGSSSGTGRASNQYLPGAGC